MSKLYETLKELALVMEKRAGTAQSLGEGGGDVFDDDFFTKRKEVMTMSNLNVLIERYTAQMKELETRMADTKHKLEIVLEATHLLVEES